MRDFGYEVFLGTSYISPADWQDFLVAVQRQIGSLRTWSLRIHFDRQVIHYFVQSPVELPPSMQLAKFLLKPATLPAEPKADMGWSLVHRLEDNCTALAASLIRKHQHLSMLVLRLNGWRQGIIASVDAIVNDNTQALRRHLLLSSPATLLSVDFAQNRNFSYKKIPKYLNIDKISKLLLPTGQSSLLEVDAFPYSIAKSYLQLEQYDFARHSLILGGSGMGKSKFIASMVNQLYQQHHDEYQIVIVDPHDALKSDLAHIADRRVVDFVDSANGINLFTASSQGLSASIELLLGLFQSLIADNYNSRLERVLRHGIYLLSTAQIFSFTTLRELLTNLEYRQQLLNQWQNKLPASITQFFLTDFQELKTKAYSESIAPIIAFIDEMQMVPAFNQECKTVGLEGVLQNNFLTIFSLNRLKFGDKVVRTLAGLLMQQLFLLAQNRSENRHLIVAIDEVAVVENPILPRFLSELRKYGVSVFLAGQYFAQISPNLRDSIFANVSNFYLFRVSRADANLLAQNLEIKLVGGDIMDDQAKLLASLKSRECLVQISSEGKNLPIFKASTTDYASGEPVPAKPIPQVSVTQSSDVATDSNFDFAFDDADIGDLMLSISTSRQTLKH